MPFVLDFPLQEDDPDHGFRELIGGGSELSQLNAMLPADDTILKGAFFKKCAVIGSSGEGSNASRFHRLPSSALQQQ